MLLVSLLVAYSLSAQTIKTVTVSQKDPFTDHVTMLEDAKDKDLMVKFVFDEAANTLTVRLISYRTLFVFREDVRYKPLIKGRTIRPDMLPYVVTYDPKEKYRISKLFKSTVPRPRKRYVFKRWIDYEGIQPVPQEYTMVNDYVEQVFDILGKRSQVTLTLHDVMLMERLETKSGKPGKYEIPFGRELNLQYNVVIERNPCFGLDEDVAAAKAAYESVAKGYASLKEKFSTGKVTSQESLDVFEQMKGLLQEQYPAKYISSPCPDIQESWDKYNQVVDSIFSMRCIVTGTTEGSGVGGAIGGGVDAKYLLSKTRQLDASVARWLVSNDAIERRDLIQRCESIIQDVKSSVAEKGVYTAEQQRAMSVFREAEAYYKNKCKK